MSGRTSCIILWATILAICTFGLTYAGNGTNSGEFLRIPTYSQGSSLGGSYVALAEGNGALFFNPAGIGRSGFTEFSLSHSDLYQDLRLENLSVTIPFAGGYGLGLSTTYLGYGSIAGYDVDGNSTGDLSAYSAVFTLGLSHQFSDLVSLGVAIKPVFEELAGYSARTVAFDAGVLLDWGRVAVGAQYANLGGGLRFLAEETPLPKTLRVGIAVRGIGGASTMAMAASSESGGDLALSGGLEYNYSRNLILRASYRDVLSGQGSGTGSVGLGLGLLLSPLRLDYSYQPAGALDEIHHITATFQFGN
jgi:opacity protein-like surface antigen